MALATTKQLREEECSGMELFDFVKTNTHTHDLETSRDAARATEGRARKIRSVLRKALRKAGCPLSAEQLSDRTRLIGARVTYGDFRETP